MANALWTPGREGFLLGEIDWDLATIKASLVRGYTFAAAHKFVSEVTAAGGVLAATATLTAKTGTGGTANAAGVTFTAVAANASNHYLMLYQASAVGGGGDVAATAQRLIAWIDTGTNIPVVPNGGDITVAWDTGVNKIFTL